MSWPLLFHRACHAFDLSHNRSLWSSTQGTCCREVHILGAIPRPKDKYKFASAEGASGENLRISVSLSAKNTLKWGSWVNQSDLPESKSISALSRIKVTNQSHYCRTRQSKSQIKVKNLERENAVLESTAPINNCTPPLTTRGWHVDVVARVVADDDGYRLLEIIFEICIRDKTIL